MTKCSTFGGLFQAPKSRRLAVGFGGGHVSSDGGVILLRGIEERLGVIRDAAKVVGKYDTRQQALVVHDIRSMLAQRILGIACGYEDLNDHKSLCADPLIQSVCGRDESLASPSTLCRLEQGASRGMNAELSQLPVETFVKSFKTPPEELTLDFDATDSIIHGNQEGRFFHGYYGHYCYLPLYVFCGHQLLAAYLRPADGDGARHAWAILALLVKRLRKQWPGVKITFRGDSGFCRHRMLGWCERHGVGYIVGIAGNSVLKQLGAGLSAKVKAQSEATQTPQKEYGEFRYAAKTWTRERRVIHKAEHNAMGGNDRFIVTSLEGEAGALYADVYCARGDMENRIKEQQLDLFADRTSSRAFAANQLRLLLSAFAYVLMERLRALALAETAFASAQCRTIRLKLLKIGAVVTRNTRSLRVSLSSSYPYVEAFSLIAGRVAMLT